MNNTCTEEAKVFHKILDEKIEGFIREAGVLMRESYDEAGNTDSSFLELHLKILQQDIHRFEVLFAGKGDSEEYNLFFKALFNTMTEGFLKGYLIGRLGIRAGHNPYNWQYLGKKFVEVTERQEPQEKEGQS